MKRRLWGLKFGLVLVGFFILLGWTASGWGRPEDTSHLSLRLEAPSFQHPFGLDEEGRDLLRLVLYGTRLSISVSFLTVLISAVFGLAFGLAAGYWGRGWEKVFVFVTDVIMAFPSILLAIALAAFYREGGLFSMVLILSVSGWVSYARIARGQVMSLREKEYVLAAEGYGAGFFRIGWRHLLPNLLAPLLVNATFGMAGVILAESTLSFLGLGIRSDLPSWGRLLDQGIQYLLVAPHLVIFPGLAIALLILGFNFLGDGLRDYFDVKEAR